MSLAPGTRVGQYEIGPLLGAGGMGEVYRARDLTLHREVALKILGGAGLEEPGALARFEREARLLASLNHPLIASIYGIVDTGAVCAIAMEVVEGPTLVERLADGALPVRDALSIAAQIAEAIEAAHDKGIVHRDLKPANIKFSSSGAAKVLDFGIAKAVEADAAAVSQASTVEATRAGTIIGTAAYMSPEQARGLPVDARTDVWAFGVVLYEMLTGRRAFDGQTTQDVFTAVLTVTPDWTALPPAVPPAIVRLLQRCLERDPSRRLRQIGTARYAIEELQSKEGSRAPDTPRRTFPWGGVAAFAAGAAIFAGVPAMLRAPAASAPPEPAAILSMAEPDGESLYLFAGPIALSPDGTRVALVTNSSEGKPRIWLRNLAAMSAEPLRGAEGGMNPFWSPDGKSLGFFADGWLKIVDLASGAVRRLVPWKGSFGGAWGRNGVIVFADITGITRVAAAGGDVTQLTSIDAASQGAVFHAAPGFLPDGHHYLFFAGNGRTGQGAVMAGSIDAPGSQQVMVSQSMALYTPPGYLLYQRDGEIVAQRFNASTQSVDGDPAVLAGGAWAWNTGGAVALSASDTGMLMFATRRTVTTRLTWFDRSGRPSGTLAEPGEWVSLAVSPDERTLAAERIDPRTGAGAVWTVDVSRNVLSRLTPESSWSLAPLWSPDGTRIIYGASREGASNLFIRAADGGDAEKPFYTSSELKVPTDWTGDGRVVYTAIGPASADVMARAAGGDAPPGPLVRTPANEGYGKVSPNGRWLAYTSNESGRPEVYVRSIAGPGRWPISRSGGGQPRWRRDGTELYFVSADSTLMAVRVTATGAQFGAAEPEALPIKVQPDVTGWRYTYDVASLGQRFIVSTPVARDTTPPIIVIPHWAALLRK